MGSKVIFKDASVMPLMEEYRLRVSANMVLMKIFEPKRDEVEIAYSEASRYVLIKHKSVDHIKGNEMHRACGTYQRKER